MYDLQLSNDHLSINSSYREFCTIANFSFQLQSSNNLASRDKKIWNVIVSNKQTTGRNEILIRHFGKCLH